MKRFLWTIAPVCLGMMACDGAVESGTSGVGGAPPGSSSTWPKGPVTVATQASSGSAGGAIDPVALCDAAVAHASTCDLAHLGLGGGGGLPNFSCTGTNICKAKCIVEANCHEIEHFGGNFVECWYCCDNPHKCN